MPPMSLKLLTMLSLAMLISLLQLVESKVLFTEAMPDEITLPPDQFSNKFNRSLLVLVAPSVWDNFYREKFLDLLAFQGKFIQSILHRDNVLIIADTHTIPYLTGEAEPDLGLDIPEDIIVEGNIYDIFIRDFAPIGRQSAKFKYFPEGMEPTFAKQVDESFNRFLKNNYIDLKERSLLSLLGGDVVDNDKDKAIVNHEIIEANKNVLQDWAIMIKLFNTLGRTAFVKVTNSTVFNEKSTLKVGDMMTFIDDDMLALSELDEPARTYLIDEIKAVFRDVHVLEIPVYYSDETWNKFNSACGIYTNMVSTQNCIYVPVFGNDPENWKRGFSSIMDKQAVELVQVNTRKMVVPVNIPHSICEMGASLKRFVWQVKGPLADRLVDLGRRRAFTEEVKRAKLH